jgi:hypothetical protein
MFYAAGVVRLARAMGRCSSLLTLNANPLCIDGIVLIEKSSCYTPSLLPGRHRFHVQFGNGHVCRSRRVYHRDEGPACARQLLASRLRILPVSSHGR